MPRALLLDLDGTLIDSAPDLHEVLNAQLLAAGHAALSLAQVQSMIGDGVRVLLRRALVAVGARDVDASLEAMLPGFTAAYAACPMRLTRPYEGVADTLPRLREAGWQLALCTNKPLVPTLVILDALGWRDWFGAVIGGDSTPYRKPDPQPLQAALQRLGAEAAQAVMVGDGPHDAEAAAAAGTGFVGVGYGYGSRALLTAPHPVSLVQRFADLPSRLPSPPPG